MQDEVNKIVKFLQKTHRTQGKSQGVIAVSGGIDSALSLTLLCRAIGAENVHPLFLPYNDQSVEDSKLACSWNKIPEENWKMVDISPYVDALATDLQAFDLRKGNLMARMRMMVVFDTAKDLDALVCGTENKSEHYLGYFTRFGDSASDIEPICHLYKTGVRELVEFLQLPEVFLSKAPSAGLWAGQTDEEEMGFSYQDADKALSVILGESTQELDPAVLSKVKKVVDSQAFKLQVPYTL